MKRQIQRAFTLVEILIVVVILGILAAIIVPQFAGAVEDTAVTTTKSELEKLRRAVEVFQVRNGDALPDIEAGDGTWGDLIVSTGAYLKEAPANPYVGGENAKVITIGDGPDDAFQSAYAWIYDDSTGQVWAAGFDEDDEPLPRN
ncbi:MAG: hypothetical protein CMJ35_15660 [Phycisphaerae bacterium]|nr:hypothetical protein [Phycisphaerae bacterium]MBM93024.1 hypothetical protein [Phycisphaerae bacterium]